MAKKWKNLENLEKLAKINIPFSLYFFPKMPKLQNLSLKNGQFWLIFQN